MKGSPLAGMTLPQLALLLANLIPVPGVLLLDWDIGSIVVLYWAENLVVGCYTLLKMMVTGGRDALPKILLFCVHYGAFCAVHGMLVLELTRFTGDLQDAERATTWPGPLALIQKVAGMIGHILEQAPDEFLWALLAIMISHGISFLVLFIGQQEYRRTRTSELMKAPYRRIAVLHIAIIAGAFLVARSGSPIGLLLALVALKTVMDIILHRRSHRYTPELSTDGRDSR